MEEAEAQRLLAEHEFEMERQKIMRENFQVFECSGSINHHPDCGGNCNVTTLEGIDRDIAEELMKWDELGMVASGSLPGTPLPGVPVNTFESEIRIIAMVRKLVEKGVFTEEEMDQAYAELKLERLRLIRTANEDAIREARTRNKLGVDVMGPKVVLPPGVDRKMQ